MPQQAPLLAAGQHYWDAGDRAAVTHPMQLKPANVPMVRCGEAQDAGIGDSASPPSRAIPRRGPKRLKRRKSKVSLNGGNRGDGSSGMFAAKCAGPVPSCAYFWQGCDTAARRVGVGCRSSDLGIWQGKRRARTFHLGI